MRKLLYFLPFWAVIFLLGVGLTACKDNTPSQPETPETLSCTDLDSIYTLMGVIEQQLSASRLNWDKTKADLNQLHRELTLNLKDQKNSPCYFLNHNYQPERDQFFFIELLTEVTIRQDLEEGILFLVKFRGLFIEDKEITEFISEDLAHVAYHNPQVYLSYLKSNAEQEEMLLNSTRWVTTDKTSLIASFDTLEGSENIVKFLKERI